MKSERRDSELGRLHVHRDHDGEPRPRGPHYFGPLQPPLRPGGGGGLGDAAVQPEATAGRQVAEVREAPEWRAILQQGIPLLPTGKMASQSA